MFARLAVVTLLACAACHGSDDYHVQAPLHDAAIDAAPCAYTSCASEHATCGPIGDGCTATLDCGSCTAPDFCGGGGTAFACGGGSGSGACVPATCASTGAACGAVADGCGGMTPSCGTCPTGQTCGGAGVANQCGAPPCTGLCTQQDACPAQPHTTISGRVTAPGHDDVATWGVADPIYGALVYIPNGSAGPPRYGVAPFAPGVACGTCNSQVSGEPLVSVTTGVDGTFILDDAPCGTDIPLVIQLGRWRRMITIPAVACCANTALAAAQTHLPRTRTGAPGDLYSDLPQIAVSTGAVDALHCVLRKAGIADSEFTNPDKPGRVHLYAGNGAVIDAATPAASTLTASAATLARYDQVLFECVGARDTKPAAEQQRVIAYADAGGRVFATHFAYVWLTNHDGTTSPPAGPKPFSQTATWDVDQGSFDSANALVDQTPQADASTHARRVAFAQWLQLVGASTALGQLALANVRHDLDAISSVPATASATPPQRWLYVGGTPFSGAVHYTFDTPIAYAPSPAPTTQCGRVVYSDFHVSDAAAGGITFPAECADAPMTPQERALEFMLFDLASCIGPPASACTPRTCADQHVGCGPAGDGCDDGVVLHCGGCVDGTVCGQGGPSTCGTGLCTPRTCADAGAECGPIGNGCGGVLQCGACAAGETCGGGGQANHCGLVLQ